MGTIRVIIVDNDDNGETYTYRFPVTRPHSVVSHGRIRNRAVATAYRALGIEGHRLTVTTRGSDD